MERGFKYRIYPNESQRDQIARTFGCCRFVYNRALDVKKTAYSETGKSIATNDLIKMIPAWKRDPDTSWLAQADSMALQQSIRDLDRAYKNFFRRVREGGKPGFPKFKSRRHARQSYRTNGGKAETALAPAIVHMKATDGYTAGRALDNYARVDLFRNGGGDGLEGHDEDQVTQTAKAVTVPPTNLDQTGRNVIIGLAAALAVAAAAAAALIYRRRTRGSAADDDEPDDDGYGREDYGHEDRYGDGCDRDDYGYDDRYRDEIRDRY